jgi:hypothetical protein
LPDGRWPLAFALGLVHGFGFVAALSDLGTTRVVTSLLGFNLGVELGQLVIVSLFVPVAFALRRRTAYLWGMRLVSLAIAAVAGFWLVERW